jgi:phosphoribosylformylglycinamidine synthase
LTAGHPPTLDLVLERRVQQVVREAIAAGLTTCAHDCGLGGLAVALAEMAIASAIGLVVDGTVGNGAAGRRDERWFGEVGSGIVVACTIDQAEAIERRAEAANVSIARIGRVGGTDLVLADDAVVGLEAAIAAYERTALY